MYLRGCDAVLAPVDPLHTQAEEGKNGQRAPHGTCLSLPALLLTLENLSQTVGIAETTKKNLIHSLLTFVPCAITRLLMDAREPWLTRLSMSKSRSKAWVGARLWDSQAFGCLTPTKGIPIPLKAVGVWHLNVFEDLNEWEWQIFTEPTEVWFAHSVRYNYITCKVICYWSSLVGAASRADGPVSAW